MVVPILRIKGYRCHNPKCEVNFTIEWNKRRMPYCPNCGDNADVTRNPSQKRRKLKTNIKKPYWTQQQLDALILFHRSTNLTQKQIGEKIGRSESAVYQKLKEIKNGLANGHAHPISKLSKPTH